MVNKRPKLSPDCTFMVKEVLTNPPLMRQSSSLGGVSWLSVKDVMMKRDNYGAFGGIAPKWVIFWEIGGYVARHIKRLYDCSCDAI